tara:strand:- start:192 stop:452 length:261 start_codon:yes stop_codon:yes gene_type:complete
MNYKIEIYTGPSCYYCTQAKNLFDSKKIKYKEIKLELFPEKREEMLNRTGGIYTIPQIFINDKYIGGFTDLNLLDIKGKLDKLLKE